MRVSIVTLENAYPYRGGTSELLFNYSAGLLERGQPTLVITFINRYRWEGVKVVTYRYYYDYSQTFNSKPTAHVGILKALANFCGINGNAVRMNLDAKFYNFLKVNLTEFDADVTLILTCWPAPVTTLAAKSLKIPAVLCLNSIESDPRHGLNTVNRILAHFAENMGIHFSTMVTTASKEDEKILTSRGVPKDKIELLPNCIDDTKYRHVSQHEIEETRRKLGTTECSTIIFVGGLSYRPNRLAVKRIYEKIMPRILNEIPNCKFLITGESPPLEYKHPAIIFTGPIYGKELALHVLSADVGIAPIEMGTGTRLKMLEYFAAGRPVVSTTIGAMGLYAEDGENILIADNYTDFSKKVVYLLKNSAEGKRLGENAKKTFTDYYCRDVVISRLMKLIKQVL